MQHPAHCLNCNKTFESGDNYCAVCGQRADTHARITMHHINHEVVHAVTHADKGFFYLIKCLALQPGTTIKEYLSGRHKKYFSPFTFFFIILGIYVLSNSVFKPFDGAVSASKKNYPVQYKTERQRQKFDRIYKRQAEAMHFMNTRTNIVLCISTPFIALILFMFYRRMHYAEHLVIMTFINAFLNLLSIFIFSPLMYLAKGSNIYLLLVAAMLIVHLMYIAVVYHRVLGLPQTFGGRLKSVGTAFAAMLGWFLLSFVCMFVYISWGVF